MKTDTLLPVALDALSAHVALVDSRGVIFAVNEPWRRFAAENGYPGDACGVGDNYLGVCESSTAAGDDGSAETMAAGLRSVLSGASERFELEYPCHSPTEERWFRLQIGAYEEDGERRAVVAHENITKLKQAEREAQRQRDVVEVELARARAELVRQTRLVTIGQVAASIAHELRNPLGAIRNACFLIRRKAPEADPKIGRYLGIIEKEVAGSDQIISDLMEMSRPKEPRREEVNAAAVAGEAFDAVSRPEDARLEIDAEQVWFRADGGQIRQVLINLMSNAVSAAETTARGDAPVRVRFGARRSGAWIELTVEDNGPGVPGDLRERVFEPMFSTKAKGTGLGLAICRQIVHQHGGEIRIGSASPDLGGAAVLIRIPVVLDSAGAGEGVRA